MSSYGNNLTTDAFHVNKIIQNEGFEKRNITFVTVLNAATTATLGGSSGLYVLSIDAASTPAAIRKVALTFTPSPKPNEFFSPRVKVLNVYEQTATNEVLFACNVQKKTDTTFDLRIANNDGSTNITTTIDVVLEVFFDGA